MKTIAITAVLFCFGCASTGNKQIMNASFMDGLKIDVTTKDEVKTLLGDPQHTGTPGGGVEVWRYSGIEKSVTLACFIPIVDIVAGRQTIRSRVVDVYFGTSGVVYDINVTSDMSESLMPIGTLMLAGAVAGAGAGYAANPCRSGYYSSGRYCGRGYGNPGKAIINTIPTGGGGSMTTIKWYK